MFYHLHLFRSLPDTIGRTNLDLLEYLWSSLSCWRVWKDKENMIRSEKAWLLLVLDSVSGGLTWPIPRWEWDDRIRSQTHQRWLWQHPHAGGSWWRQSPGVMGKEVICAILLKTFITHGSCCHIIKTNVSKFIFRLTITLMFLFSS